MHVHSLRCSLSVIFGGQSQRGKVVIVPELDSYVVVCLILHSLERIIVFSYYGFF